MGVLFTFDKGLNFVLTTHIHFTEKLSNTNACVNSCLNGQIHSKPFSQPTKLVGISPIHFYLICMISVEMGQELYVSYTGIMYNLA